MFIQTAIFSFDVLPNEWLHLGDIPRSRIGNIHHIELQL